MVILNASWDLPILVCKHFGQKPMRFRFYPSIFLRSAHLFIAFTFALTACQFIQAQEETAFNVYTGPRSLDGAQTSAVREAPEDPTAMFAAALFREAGLEFTHSVIPWSRAVQSVQNEANVLVYSMIRNAQREDLYEWIGLINPIETHLYMLRDMLDSVPTTLAEARDLRIGLARRSAADEFLSSQGFTNLVYSGNPTRAPVLLERGRIQLTPMTRQEAIGVIEDFNLEAGALVPTVRLAELSTGTYFVVSKQTDPALVERLKQAYRALVDDGTHQRFFGDQNLPD